MAYNQESVIKPAVIKFSNLSQNLEWKSYRDLFGQFGQINKLYIDPTGSFGNVQFLNSEDAYKAQKELDGKPPLKLVVGKPAKVDSFRLSSFSSNTSLLEKSSTMHRRSYSRYNEKNDDVDVIPSVTEYVDAYGRILDTLESEDGREVYVPISDLRRSGFQVFPLGSLPKRGDRAFEEQLFSQHERYLKTKSIEFMTVTQQSFSKEKVNAAIQILQSEYQSIHYQTAVDNEGCSRTITSPNVTSNRRQGRSPYGGRPSYEKRNFDGQERRVHSTYSNNTNSTDNNRSDRAAKGGSSAATNNFQSQQSFGDAKTFDGRNKGYYNNRSELGKKTAQREEPVNCPIPPLLVKNTSQRQEEDGTNLVRAQKQPVENEASPQKPTASFGESVGTDTNRAPLLRRPNSNAPEEEIKASPIKKIGQTTSNNSQTVQPPRKTVIEKEAASGYFDCTEIINEDTFVGVAMPATYVEDVCTLDCITDDCKPDPTFKPNVGDTVAVNKDDAYVRGVVISNLNGQYTCALIDYGLTIVENKVCPLPDKYMKIPEFACLCKADNATIQEISKSSEHLMEIKSPSRIMVTIKDSGKVCEVIGRRWDPFETAKKNKPVDELPVEEKQIVKEETTYRTPLKFYQLKPSDIVILVSEVEGSLIVRTRECDITLKDIKLELNNYQGKPFTKQPEVDQLVVCPFRDGALYRGMVLSVKSPNVVIKYIDYGNCETIPIKELRTISEKLANLPSTAITISLKGFVKSKFSSKALSYLEECAGRREKFNIISGNNDQVYDLLFKDNSSLSEKLIALNKPSTVSNTEALPATVKAPSVAVTPSPRTVTPSPRAVTPSPRAVTPSPRAVTPSPRAVTPSPTAVTPLPRAVTPKTESSPIILTDIPRCKLNIGDNEVMCLFAGDAAEGTASFCIADPEKIANKMLELSNRVNTHIEKDHIPYHPKLFEVCLAKFDGDWYRAAFIKEFDNNYGMFYLDYGNTKTVTAEDIRKLPKELAEIECLSALCILQGIKQDDQPIKEPLLSKLVQSITENEFYKIHVVKEENNCYIITIPLLFNEWKKEGLLS